MSNYFLNFFLGGVYENEFENPGLNILYMLIIQHFEFSLKLFNCTLTSLAISIWVDLLY